MIEDMQRWDEFIKEYNEKMPAYCHEVFVKNPVGRKLINMALKRLSTEPIFIFGQSIEHAAFRQGALNIVRDFENMAKSFAAGETKGKPTVVKRNLTKEKNK